MSDKPENAHSPKIEIPYKLVNDEGLLKCKWVDITGKRFIEPFFEDTIRRCRYRAIEENRELNGTTPLEDIMQAAKHLEPVTPAMIVFHLSRCGSTLISQAFASSDRYIVLAEVSFLDELLRMPLTNPDAAKEYDINALFEASLRCYGRKQGTGAQKVMIKTDCWHIFFYEQYRKLFPNVPFILMYRRPEEVLRSLMNKPAMHTSLEYIEPEIFGFPGPPESYQLKTYGAAIIEKMLQKFLEVAETDDNSLLVNYNEGALPIVKKIAAFSKLELDEAELQVMEERCRYHSKNPDELFDKEPVADIPECLNGAMKLYEWLEVKRIADSA